MRRLLVPALLLGCLITAALSTSASAATTPVPKACSAGYVNLSFDDSPTQYTPALLSALKTLNLKATFFDVGDRLAAYPTYAKTQVSGGHQVENHTQSHGDLTSAASPISDLVRSEYLLIQQTGIVPTFYRPPYGATNPGVRTDVAQLGLTEVIWTVDTVDWSSPSVASIVAAAKTVKPGGFVLMHDGYANTISALPQIAANLTAAGLCAGKITTSSTPTNAWEGLDFNATVAPF